MPSLPFPSVATQVLSFCIHFMGVSVIAHCLSRRVASESLLSLQGLAQLTWPRACVILIFFDSWLFLFLSGVLIFGVGLELDGRICSSAIYLCIVFYATSKLLIYCFLIEKVYVVWSPASGTRRFQSPVYVVCFVTVALYAVVITTMLIGRNTHLRGADGNCIIGLKPYSSIPLVSYDLYVNVFLTALFLVPLFKRTNKNPRVRRVARRTLLGAAVALTTSTVNIAVLVALRGNELGWVCLGSCGGDVILNALALFWVTRKGSGMHVVPISTVSKSPSLGSENTNDTTRSSGIPMQPPHSGPSRQNRIVVGNSHNLFTRAKSAPKVPESRVNITLGPSPSPEKPKLPSFGKLLRAQKEAEPELTSELQITVTTDLEVQSEYEHAEEKVESECPPGSKPEPRTSTAE